MRSGPACPGNELRDDMAGGGAGSGLSVRERGCCRHLRGTVRVAAGRRDRHGCLQRDVCVLAAHRAAVDEPAAICLVLGYGYAWPAGLKVRREPTAIAGWPDHDASVALRSPKGAATRGRANYHVTHVLLQEGHLWGGMQAAIPISAVTRVDDGIRLNITKHEVQNLPPVDVDHPNA